MIDIKTAIKLLSEQYECDMEVILTQWIEATEQLMNSTEDE